MLHLCPAVVTSTRYMSYSQCYTKYITTLINIVFLSKLEGRSDKPEREREREREGERERERGGR